MKPHHRSTQIWHALSRDQTVSSAAHAVTTKASKMWKDKSIGNNTKLRLVKNKVWPVMSYGREATHVRLTEQVTTITAALCCHKHLLNIHPHDRQTGRQTEPMLHALGPALVIAAKYANCNIKTYSILKCPRHSLKDKVKTKPWAVKANIQPFSTKLTRQTKCS